MTKSNLGDKRIALTYIPRPQSMTERTQAGTENRTSCKIASNQGTHSQENIAESMKEYYLLSLPGSCTDSVLIQLKTPDN